MTRPDANVASASGGISRFSVANLRAAWWALLSARHARKRLRHESLDAALGVAPPPPLPPQAKRGVEAMLRRRGDSCLVRSIVLQAWLAAHGERRDLIIGVKTPGEEFGAHAWLEGEPAHVGEPFHELLRRPVP